MDDEDIVEITAKRAVQKLIHSKEKGGELTKKEHVQGTLKNIAELKQAIQNIEQSLLEKSESSYVTKKRKEKKKDFQQITKEGDENEEKMNSIIISTLKQDYLKACDDVKRLYGSKGCASGYGHYNALPQISKEDFEASMLHYKERLKKAELNFEKPKDFIYQEFACARISTEQAAKQIKAAEDNARTTLYNIKSEYLSFLQTKEPIDSKAFFAALHPLLDTMTEQLQALREIQRKGVDIGDFKAL